MKKILKRKNPREKKLINENTSKKQNKKKQKR
jgi:hypothetical protein